MNENRPKRARRLWPAAALGIALLGAPVFADPGKAELQAVEAAEALGGEMYAYDQAAWHATDSIQSDIKREGRSLDKLVAAGLKGYVVEPAGEGLLLATFYAVNDGSTSGLARYWVAGSEVRRGGFLEQGDDPALSVLALQLVAIRTKAIDAAIAEDFRLCSESQPNTIVLPPRSDGTIPAYVLTSTVDAGIYPAGGHFRLDYDAQGSLVGKRPFMKTCFPLDYRKRPAFIALSHLLDPQPTEIHAFVSRNIPVSLVLITTQNNMIWEAKAGRIRFVEEGSKP